MLQRPLSFVRITFSLSIVNPARQFSRIDGRMRRSLTLLVAACSAMMMSVAQADVTYVGPYTYRNDRNLGFNSEAEAVADWFRYSTASGAICMTEPFATGGWPASGSSVLLVEGVERQNSRPYSAYWGGKAGGECHINSTMSTYIQRNRTVCGWYQRYDQVSKTCMTGIYVTLYGSAGGNQGSSCPACQAPINPMTGNMWHVIDDYAPIAYATLGLRRTYNSSPNYQDPNTVHGFGVRWTTPYDAKLRQEYAVSPPYLKSCWKRSDGLIICDSPPQPQVAALPVPAALSISRGDGNRYFFNHVGNDWVSDAYVNDRVSAIYNADNTAVIEWTYYDAKQDATEHFDANGLLLSINPRNGRSQVLTYSDGLSNDSSVSRYPATAPACASPHPGSLVPAGRILCVTDNWGHQLQFRYDVIGRIVEAIDPDGRSYLYQYDGPSGGCVAGNENKAPCSASNLTKVTYPDGHSQTYFYNEAALVNGGASCSPLPSAGNGFASLTSNLTGLIDENGGRYLTWSYYCTGQAKSSETAGGVDKVVLSYTNPSYPTTTRTATVTHTVGTATAPQVTNRTYSTNHILGVGKNTNIDQPCVECGSIKARTYDANGNIASTTDFNNAVTKFVYDLARNLETQRTEAFGTAQVRYINTAWHPSLRLPVQIAEPLRMTTFDYDAAGNLLTKTVRATSDSSGVSGFSATLVGLQRIWRYTYNPQGQILTITGPRTDVADMTSYAYDAKGNVSSVTNAAGHQTQFSAYDGSGHVGQITDPNGLITTLSYNARGWLTSRSVGGEVTSYEYDGVGQLTRVTQPDTSTVNFTYDGAHRLTTVADSLGNTISYTLDLNGKRIAETVTDVNGVLARQITRVYDTLNRLQKVTGAQQ